LLDDDPVAITIGPAGTNRAAHARANGAPVAAPAAASCAFATGGNTNSAAAATLVINGFRIMTSS
jgi:hypothetical protein